MAAFGGPGAERSLRALLRSRFEASSVLLTDSGTSALIAALRATSGRTGTIALPAYSCIDLTAATLFAGRRVRLYDVDPDSLSPDLESLERVLNAGVDVVVVAHLYGVPADISAVCRLAASHCVPVIEDAAQGAGARVAGRPIGSHGALSVLSFGRGKGVTGGRGGALLVHDPAFDGCVSDSSAGAGVGDVVRAAVQWLMGRPGLFAIPASVPSLRIGEMVYAPAHEPRSMSRAAAAMVISALRSADAERIARHRHAARLKRAVERSVSIRLVKSAVADGEPGYLRLPVLDQGGRAAAPRLGIQRSYPLAMNEQLELRPALCAGERCHGAELLARHLFTLPTHSLLRDDDLARIEAWLTAGGASYSDGMDIGCIPQHSR